MKILIIPSWYECNTNPTLGSFFREQAECLARKDIEVIIAYPGFNGLKTLGKNNVGINSYTKNGVKVYRYDTSNYLYDRMPIDIKSRLFKRKLFKLYKIIQKECGKPDIIHAHSSTLAGYGSVELGNKYNIPVIITEHSSSFLHHKLKKDNKKLIRKSLDSCQKIITVSKGLEVNILKYTTNENISVIPNIIDINKFKINSVKREGKFTFLVVCYLNKNKGVDILIKAFTKAFKNNPKYKLVIGGDGNEKNNLIELVSSLEINNQVDFLGPLSREKVEIEMNKANCFVLPSRYETFGVVLIEALACGLPLISTKTCGPMDIVNDSNGILVGIDNIQELSEAMIYMSKNYNIFNKQMLRNDCINKYSEENIINKIIFEYNKILQKRGN